MKKRHPDSGAALGNKRLESGVGTRNLVAQLSRRNQVAFTAWCGLELDDETRSDLRRIWWNFRRADQTLPAEPRIILIHGSR